MAKRAESKPDTAEGLRLMWGSQQAPSRGPKPALTTDRIVATAMAIADAKGMKAVSMQRVASEFGFTTMSLYRYVPSKTVLLDLMVDAAAGTAPDLNEHPGDWRAKLAGWTRMTRDSVLRHPWFLEVPRTKRSVMGPRQLAWANSALAVLADTGLSAKDQHDAFLLLIGLAHNAARQEHDSKAAADPIGTEEWSTVVTEMTRQDQRYSALVTAIKAGAFVPDGSDPLEFGLQCVLDGLAVKLRDAQPM